MFCRNCGQKLADGDKFCSSCGTKTQVEDNAAAAVESVSPEVKTEDKPLFEPFDFKAFGFDFSDLGLGTGTKKEETAAESKPTPPTEKFDWNTGAFPNANTATKTEDVNFNWSLSPETPEPAAEPEIFTAPEPVWGGADDTAAQEETVSDLEAELFGDIESKADETRKQSEEIDKFFTFHKKNEEFQKILDREYEKVKTGNIITEEMNAADAASEEKFTARQPEDPMEEMFAEAGVIKGYEPKPVETDVLERIEAAEAEKRIKEEAERIAEAKRAEMAAAEAQAEAPAEEPAEETAVEAEPVAADETAAEAETEEVEEITAEDVTETEAADETPAVEEIEAETVETEAVEAEEPAEEAPAEELNLESVAADETEEVEPVKTRQVDKAAILAEMALASEMVERDKAMAAAQGAAAAEAVVEDIKFDLPDFLGHQEAETAEEPVEEPVAVAEITFDEPVVEPVAVEEPVIDIPVEPISFDAPVVETIMTEEPAEEPAADDTADIAFDIFEQLEGMTAPEEEETVTAHTVVLTEDSVAEILKTVEEDTTKDDTMVFTAHALGALLAEAEQNDPDASEVVVSLEELTALEQQAAEGTLPPVGAVAEEAEDDEEEIQGGKGRTFLKICLVILVILLAIEIAGVAIRILAPTSGAADFIDTQLNKVFQLISDEDADPENYNA